MTNGNIEYGPWTSERISPLIGIKYRVSSHSLDFKIELNHISAPEELDGFLKWDGCLNIRHSEDGYMHFCGPEKEPLLAKALRAVYDLGSKMDAWDFGPSSDTWRR